MGTNITGSQCAAPASGHHLPSKQRATIEHLSDLVNQQCKLLVEIENMLGYDWFGQEIKEGESEIIDKVRAMLVATTAITQPARIPLTDERILMALGAAVHKTPKRLPYGWKNFARAIEAAHGITKAGGAA